MNRLIPILLLTVGMLLVACDYDTIQRDNIMQVEIANDSEYQLNLGLQQILGRPGIVEAHISRQADFFRISKLTFEVTALGVEDALIYSYLAAQDFVGRDWVEIKVCRGAACADANSSEEVVVIEFIVRN